MNVRPAIAAALVAAGLGFGACAPRPVAESRPAAAEGGKASWDKFDGGHGDVDVTNTRSVPETPTEITSVPYVRGVRLSWSKADDVPSYEPSNETLKVPADARQAVLAVAVANLPEDARLRVDWFYGDDPVFADDMRSTDDGDHYFALVKREGKTLKPLPPGKYRAELLDGAKSIKTLKFEVLGS